MGKPDTNGQAPTPAPGETIGLSARVVPSLRRGVLLDTVELVVSCELDGCEHVGDAIYVDVHYPLLAMAAHQRTHNGSSAHGPRIWRPGT